MRGICIIMMRMMIMVIMIMMIMVKEGNASRFVVEKASLRLFVDGVRLGEYDAALGDFGFPLYGRVLAGQVLHNSDDKSRSCTEVGTKYTSNDASADGKLNSTTVPVALVERGGCYFAEKAYYAQKAGAKAVLIMDDQVEPLITMSKPQSSDELQPIVDAVTVPTVLISREHGKKIEYNLSFGKEVIVEFDFREAMPNPDDRVEWELWGTSSDRCGSGCDTLKALHKSFNTKATYLMRLDYTEFTPYYIFDPRCYSHSDDACAAMCIRGWRYCVPRLQLSGDPSQNPEMDQSLPSYRGEDIAYENLRQLCMMEQFKKFKQPWLWWRYVANFAQMCTMDKGTFTRIRDASCSDKVLDETLKFSYHMSRRVAGTNAAQSSSYAYTGRFSMKKFHECAGVVVKKGLPERYVDVDEPHPLLEKQLEEQMDNRRTGRGVVTLLPTVVINTNQYRGRINDHMILSALCSGFSENDEPAACMNEKYEVNECRDQTDTCWRKTLTKTASGRSVSLSACIDTFRGFECQCPNGWQGDGYECTDIDECSNGKAKCDHVCKNTQGGYNCVCNPGFRLVGKGTCIFTNNCLPSNGGCEERCIPVVPDSVKCACSDGLELAEDGKRCKDVDECATGLASCEQLCINMDPRTDDLGRKYACACEPNYVLNMTDPSFRKCLPVTSLAGGPAAALMVTGGGSRKRSISQTFMIAMGSTTILLLSALVAVLMYRRRMHRDEMSQEVRNIMKDYIALSADDKDREAGFGLDDIGVHTHGQYSSPRYLSSSSPSSKSPSPSPQQQADSSLPMLPSSSTSFAATGPTVLMASAPDALLPSSHMSPPPFDAPMPTGDGGGGGSSGTRDEDVQEQEQHHMSAGVSGDDAV